MIGIFGGTFDPIHYGHLRSALEVKHIFGLTEVRLIPSYQPPHRDKPHGSVGSRLHMLRLAIEGQNGFKIDTREIDRQGVSFMVDTLASLRQEFPSQSLLLFIGGDAFNKLTTWHQWQRLFDLSHVVVMTRPGSPIGQLDDYLVAKRVSDSQELSQNLVGKLYFQPITQLAISATAIRTMFAEQFSPRFLLPDAVIAYIRQHKLYETL